MHSPINQKCYNIISLEITLFYFENTFPTIVNMKLSFYKTQICISDGFKCYLLFLYDQIPLWMH